MTPNVTRNLTHAAHPRRLRTPPITTRRPAVSVRRHCLGQSSHFQHVRQAERGGYKWRLSNPTSQTLLGADTRSHSFIRQRSFACPSGGTQRAHLGTINTPCCQTISHQPPRARLQYQTSTTHSRLAEATHEKNVFFFLPTSSPFCFFLPLFSFLNGGLRGSSGPQ